MIRIITPDNGEIRSQMSEYAKLFYKMCDAGERTPDGTAPWCQLSEHDSSSEPAPVILSWITDIPREERDTVVHLSKTPDFSVDVTYETGCATSEPVYNLEVGTKYYWYVENLGDKNERTPVSTFQTADEYPRMMFVTHKTTNIRDCGGAVNTDGKKIKYGLLFRGSNLDDERTPDEKGNLRLKRDFGLKTDIDLRALDYVGKMEKFHKKVEAQDFMTRYIFPAGSYSGTVENTEQISTTADVFRLMCDESIYPAYIHCVSGADRTGTILFLFDILMHLDMETAVRNYELSCLGADGWDDRDSRSLYDYVVGVIMRQADDGDDIYTALDKFFDKVYHLPDAPEKLRSIFLE